MKKGLVITGVVIFIVALMAAILSMVVAAITFDSPSDDYYKTIQGSDDIYLEKGTYTIWSEEEQLVLTITSPSGKDVKVRKNMDLHLMDVYLIGTIEAEEDGTYSFLTGGLPVNIYIQEGDLNLARSYPACMGCCFGIIFIPLGAILVIVGLVFKRK